MHNNLAQGKDRWQMCKLEVESQIWFSLENAEIMHHADRIYIIIWSKPGIR